ncbi:MAG TPA: TadE/TadG family type IV pilus assembly protein [Xanthobacteraceae bacterium]|nr:TadE/TadG family type IV pilus assembly protein [Xanthobacteraceae bacterium]
MTRRWARRANRPRPHRNFSRCTKAATAVEFALVATPFFALLMALVQTGIVFFASRVLDEVAEQTSRYVLTGQAQTGGLTQAQFATYVCNNVPAIFNCANIMINVSNYATFAAANTATPTLTFDANGNVTNQWSWSPGQAGSIVIMQLMYQWPVKLGPLGFNLSNLSNGNRLLISTVAFKTEPY